MNDVIFLEKYDEKRKGFIKTNGNWKFPLREITAIREFMIEVREALPFRREGSIDYRYGPLGIRLQHRIPSRSWEIALADEDEKKEVITWLNNTFSSKFNFSRNDSHTKALEDYSSILRDAEADAPLPPGSKTSKKEKVTTAPLKSILRQKSVVSTGQPSPARNPSIFYNKTSIPKPFDPSIERRVDTDGLAYTVEQFVEFYGPNEGPIRWKRSLMAPGGSAAYSVMTPYQVTERQPLRRPRSISPSRAFIKDSESLYPPPQLLHPSEGNHPNQRHSKRSIIHVYPSPDEIDRSSNHIIESPSIGGRNNQFTYF